MTDRINYLTVVLTKDIRDDDCEPLIAAIQMMKGVLSVKPNVANAGDHVAEQRALSDLRNKV